MNAISGTETFTFATPLLLTTAESYTVNVFVTGNGPGNNTGLDGIVLNGSVIPEPSSLSLLLLGVLVPLFRARRG